MLCGCFILFQQIQWTNICVVAMFASVLDLGLRSHARHGRCSIESSMSHPSQHVVIVGGGTAGISVAARLRHRAPALRITVIDPSETHYYQPLWTLVGGGVAKKEETARPESSVIPDGVKWLKQSVTEFLPDQNHVVLSSGERLGYDYLVCAPGIQLNWSEIKGLSGHVGQDGICSNYAYEFVDQTFPTIQAVQDGNALFTHPATPIKCGGAPQKIMYLADDDFRRRGVRDKVKVKLLMAPATIFTSPYYADSLRQVIARRDIEVGYQHNLIEVRPAKKEAVFLRLDTKEEVVHSYSMIHVTPPMSAPDFVRKSALAAASGFVDVDKETLQHTRFPNIFSLGDASALPTSKTGAAIRKQVPVLVDNLIAQMDGKPLSGRYDGYTSCPLVTGYGKLVLAEFGYDGKPMESFPFDQRKERLSMYWLKRYALPILYWNGMLRGRA